MGRPIFRMLGEVYSIRLDGDAICARLICGDVASAMLSGATHLHLQGMRRHTIELTTRSCSFTDLYTGQSVSAEEIQLNGCYIIEGSECCDRAA